MLSYVLRRIGVSILIIVAASFLMYVLVALARDPLEDLYASNSPNKDALIAQRTEWLNLDQPIPGLYGVGNCVASPSARAYWAGGATLGPIIAFAYRAANAAHLEPVREEEHAWQ